MISTFTKMLFSNLKIHKNYVKKNVLIFIIIGIILNIGAFIVSEIYIPKQNLQNKIDIFECLFKNCKDQKQDLYNKIVVLNYQIKQYEKRFVGLKSAFIDPEIFGFYETRWDSIDSFKKEIDTLKNKRDKLKNYYSGNKKREYWKILLGCLAILLLLGLFIIVSHILLWHGEKAISLNKKKLNNFSKIYFATIVFLCSFHLIREVFTSINPTQKAWYGWGSFCISSVSWSLNKLSFFGGAMVGAYLFTLGFCLSSKTFQPKKISLASTGKSCGIGDYVLFLQTWSIIGSIVTFFPTIFMIKLFIKWSEGGFANIYLIDFGVIILLGTILVGRTIWRAVSIKILYWSSVEKLDKTYKEIKEMDIPPDPTTGFLGENWWRLPASLAGVFIALWALIKVTGLETLITNLLK